MGVEIDRRRRHGRGVWLREGFARDARSSHEYALSSDDSLSGRGREAGSPSNVHSMLKLIGILLIIWLVLTVLGAVIEGLFWLAIVGAVLFLGTAAYGWVKRKALR